VKTTLGGNCSHTDDVLTLVVARYSDNVNSRPIGNTAVWRNRGGGVDPLVRGNDCAAKWVIAPRCELEPEAGCYSGHGQCDGDATIIRRSRTSDKPAVASTAIGPDMKSPGLHLNNRLRLSPDRVYLRLLEGVSHKRARCWRGISIADMSS
jgi:hypothetical protein